MINVSTGMLNQVVDLVYNVNKLVESGLNILKVIFNYLNVFM